MNEFDTAAQDRAPHEEQTGQVWRRSLPKYSLWFSLGVLAWFAFAAFGPKIGMLDWRTGLGFMIRTAGPILIGVASLLAIAALLFALLKTPRGPWWKAALALAIPVVLMGGLMMVGARAKSVPPIHDVATDLRDPPEFSPEKVRLRTELEANPLVSYGTPLGDLEAWQDIDDRSLKAKNHADIIAESYPELRPIVLGDATREQAFDAVVAAMGEIGLTDVRRVESTGTVEGVAETFAFGFRDDVVVRIDDRHIDLRSVSRVGLSDLGYNAARLRELSDAIEERLTR